MGHYSVSAVSVEDLLAPGSRKFEIPRFQRRFSWRKEEVKELIDDVFVSTIEDEGEYFLGSIVLAKGDDRKAPYIVFDGQQRLTTLSLAISVLLDKMRDEAIEEPGIFESRLYEILRGGRRAPKLKLQPQDTSDYGALLEEPKRCDERRFRKTPLGAAVQALYEQLEIVLNMWKDFHPAESVPKQPLERLLFDVEMVEIVASSEGDAFRLFETLNDRGLDLSAADLIKNKLFSRADNFLSEVSDAWIDMASTVGRGELVNFLRYSAIGCYSGEDAKPIRTARLFDWYKKYVEGFSSKQILTLVESLRDLADKYAALLDQDRASDEWGEEAGEIVRRLNAYRARSVRPLLLASARFRPEIFVDMLRLCEGLTVRYSIVGQRNPNALERLYAQLSGRVANGEIEDECLFDKDWFQDIPSDKKFRQDFFEAEVTSARSAWRQILIILNERVSSGETKVQSPDKVHVEHILPENPSAKALQEANLSTAQAEEFVNRVGNLTLISGTWNRSLSNKPFSEKRLTYSKSEIKLTSELASCESWGTDQISIRSEKLADMAVEAFVSGLERWCYETREGNNTSSQKLPDA